jgi:hypothetical protein
MDDLPRIVALVADSLDTRGASFSGGVVRLAARRLVELEAELKRLRPVEATPCPQCGGPVAQPATGRRRVFCSSRCRGRAFAERNADVRGA